jgi:hypothetical protein
LGGDFVCLIGPGDSCKSAVLDALELVLTPRWNPGFDDSDFHMGDTARPIVVEATIGALPREFLSDARYGLRLRGYSSGERKIHDEHEDGDEPVITIRLTVEASLEPTWEVITLRHPEGQPISARDRESLGATRLGAVLDRHLSWSRGSVLSRLTGDNDEQTAFLAEAGRHARDQIDHEKLPRMSDAANRAATLAAKLGVRPRHGFVPHMDPVGTTGANSLVLHDGPVPLRRAGFATRRLLTLAMQRDLASSGGLILIDEVELGLEPYRLRRLLVELLSSSSPSADQTGIGRFGMVALTTHSPITLGQLRTHHVRVVRTDGGTTSIRSPTEDVQGTLIKHAEAFFSRKVIVCEGMTELGLLCGLDNAWARTREPFAVRGVGLVDGGGCSKVAAVARAFRSLGYETAILADSDVPLSESPATLQAEGIHVILWAETVATEERLFADLPRTGVVAAIRVALEEEGDLRREQLATALAVSPTSLGDDPESWFVDFSEDDLRKAVAKTSKKRSWFKNARSGAALGEVVAEQLGSIADSDLARKLLALQAWIVG